jgi:ectoine hydroxylase-related dioxygenase (phytanoyl-CoA dioxygenase family)
VTSQRLTEEQLRAFYRDGYVTVPGAIDQRSIERALGAINGDIGRGIDPARIAEFYARSFCPELRNAPELLDLFEKTPALTLAESLVGAGALRPPSMAQIALRFPQHAAAVLPRPHVDGTYGPSNGVPQGRVAHFTMLAMVALSDVEVDFAGNFTVWPGSHHLYERYFRHHDVTEMIGGTPRLAELPAPVQTRVKAGDLLLAHYELGHAAAPNLSPRVRYAIFFRLYHREHDPEALDILADIWRQYASLAHLVPERNGMTD